MDWYAREDNMKLFTDFSMASDDYAQENADNHTSQYCWLMANAWLLQ